MSANIWKGFILFACLIFPVVVNAQGAGCPAGATLPWPDCRITGIQVVTGNLQLKSFITLINPADLKKYLVFECVNLPSFTEYKDSNAPSYTVFMIPAENSDLYSSILAAYLEKAVVSIGYIKLASSSWLGRDVMAVKTFKLLP